MLIRDYKKFLKERDFKTDRIEIYALKIREFLALGYSEEELCEELDTLIKEHNKGGIYYDRFDRGLTLSALKELRKLVLTPYIKDFSISYKIGWQASEEDDEYVKSFEIAGRFINIVYVTAGGECEQSRKISNDMFFELLAIFKRNFSSLSPSNTEIKGAFGAMRSYGYVFGDKKGEGCHNLFIEKGAMREFKIFISRYLVYDETCKNPITDEDDKDRCIPIDDDDIPF